MCFYNAFRIYTTRYKTYRHLIKYANRPTKTNGRVLKQSGEDVMTEDEYLEEIGSKSVVSQLEAALFVAHRRIRTLLMNRTTDRLHPTRAPQAPAPGFYKHCAAT